MLLPTTIKKARLSADALAKSFNMQPSVTRDLLASCFNCNGWDSLCQQITNNTNKSEPSAPEAKQANDFLSEKIAQRLNIPPSKYLNNVIASCSPYAKKPKMLAYDIESARETIDKEDGINLAEMMEMVDMDSAFNDLMDLLGRDGSVDPQFIEDIKQGGVEEFQHRMRLSKPLDTFYFMLAIDKITEWKTSDESNEFEHGVPAFYYFDEHDEPQPIFINSVSIAAGDTADLNTLESLINIARDGYDELFEKPIILFGSALHRKINGDTFTVIGIWFDGYDWRWLFLSKITPWEQKKLYPNSLVNNLENSLLSPPPPKELASGFHDETGLPNYHMYHCFCNPTESPETESSTDFKFNLEPRYTVSGNTGWSTLI